MRLREMNNAGKRRKGKGEGRGMKISRIGGNAEGRRQQTMEGMEMLEIRESESTAWRIEGH